MSSIRKLKQAFNQCAEKPDATVVVNHPEWNMVAMYIINTVDYDPNSNSCDKGLDVIHTEMIALCADLSTEDWFSQEMYDTSADMAEECELDKVEPGYYRCVAGIGVQGSEWTSHEGVTEYDTDVYHHLISRTKISQSDADYYIKMNEYIPPEEEDVI